MYWLNLYDNKIKETIERATAYKAAGADGIFIPGLTNEETIKIFTEEIRLPINILAESSTPTILDLNHLNVKRLSFGSGAYRATVSNIQKIACEVMKQGHYKRMTNNSMSYEDMMDLLK